MNPYDPQAQMSPYGMPGSPMNTNPYIREAQQLPQGMGGGNPMPYSQNISDQIQSQNVASQNLAQTQGGVGRAAGGGGMMAAGGMGISAQQKADALRNIGDKIGDYANRGNIASGNKYDTGFGSEQSRMLAAQEAGLS